MEFETNTKPETKLIPQFANIQGESLLPTSYPVENRLSSCDFQEKYPVRFALFSEFATLRNDFSKEALQSIQRLSKYLFMLNKIDEYIATCEKSVETTLYPEQLRAFKQLRDGLEQGETDGRIKIPTSGGKTVIFSELIEAIGVKTGLGEMFKTLIVVPDQKPVKQTKEKLEKFAPEIPVGVVYGNKKDIGEKEQPVTVITDESLVLQLEKGSIDPLGYDLVILDEADVYLTANKQNVIQQFANATRIGFSATMEYGPNKKVESYLPYEHFSMEIKEAAEKGVISPFSAYIAKTTADVSHVSIVAGDYNESELETALDIKIRNSAAVDLYKKMFAGKSAIAYCLGVTHAEKLAKLYRENGVRAEHISGYMQEDERDEIYRKYREGEIDVLCNADLLIRSFDEPRAEVCLNLRPTLSKVVAEQRAGRVLRHDPNNPDKHAIIVDFVDENSNDKRQPILFAEIANAARVESVVSEVRNRTVKRTEPAPLPEINIEGLTVITEAEEVMRIVKEVKAEEWLSPKAISRIIGVEKDGIQSKISKLIELHPQWVKEITIGNNKQRYLINKFALSFFEKEYEKYVDPPKGWELVYDLGIEFKVGPRAFKKIVTQLSKEHPEWKNQYRTGRGKLALYISPQAKEEARKIIYGTDQLPEGWIKISEAATILGNSQATIKKYAKGLYETGTFYNEHRQTTFALSLDALVEVEGLMNGTLGVNAPDDWISLPDLAFLLQVSRDQLVAIIDKKGYRDTGVVRVHRNRESKATQFVSPDVLNEIEREILLQIPAGLISAKDLASETGISKSSIMLYAKSHYPEDYSIVSLAGRQRVTYIGATAAKWFREQSKKNGPPPPGWMTIKEIQAELKTSYKTVINAINSYRNSSPESVRTFSSNKRATLFLSPEAYAQFKQSIEAKSDTLERVTTPLPVSGSVPENFVPVAPQLGKFSVPRPTMEKRIRRLFKNNDPSVRRALVTGHSQPIYFMTQKRIEELQQEYEKAKAEVEGFVRLSDVHADTRMSESFIQALIREKNKAGDSRIKKYNRAYYITNDLAEELRKQFSRIEADEQFIPFEEAARLSGVAIDALKRRLYKLAKQNDPTVLVNGKGRSGVFLVDKNQIDHVTEGLIHAEPGYLTIPELMERFELSRGRTQALIIQALKSKRNGFSKAIVTGKKKGQYLATEVAFNEILNQHLKNFIPDDYVDINSLPEFGVNERERRNDALRILIETDNRILKRYNPKGWLTYCIAKDARTEIISSIRKKMDQF